MGTRSKLKMEYDDGKKIITLIHPVNNKVVISDQDKSILLQDQNNNKAELSSSGILLDSPKDITIKALGKVVIRHANIEATAQMDVKVTGLNITNTANVGFTAKGTATAELSVAGQTTVKGAMVMINQFLRHGEFNMPPAARITDMHACPMVTRLAADSLMLAARFLVLVYRMC